jgi:uridine kinase
VLVVGITGGSGSGKSLLAESLAAHFPSLETLVLSQDSYYRDNAHLPIPERKKINFDHPDAIDFELLLHQLDALTGGEPVQRPCYSFLTCTRSSETLLIRPPDLLLLEGIMLFCHPGLPDRMHLKIFLDTPADLRLKRILDRDIRDRGRTAEEVITRFSSVVQPMHDKFVEPCRDMANLVLYNHGSLDEIKEITVSAIRNKL